MSLPALSAFSSLGPSLTTLQPSSAASRYFSRSAANPAARLCRPFTQMPPSISMRVRLGRWAGRAQCPPRGNCHASARKRPVFPGPPEAAGGRPASGKLAVAGRRFKRRGMTCCCAAEHADRNWRHEPSKACCAAAFPRHVFPGPPESAGARMASGRVVVAELVFGFRREASGRI